MRELDGCVVALSIYEPGYPHVELDVLYGPFSYPDKIGAYRQEARIDWSRVIRVRRKCRYTPYDLGFTEVWRAPRYVQPPHLLTADGLWQPVLGEVANAELEDACYYAVLCGVARILDVRHGRADYRDELAQSRDPEVWQAILTHWQQQVHTAWIDPVAHLLADASDTNPFSLTEVA